MLSKQEVIIAGALRRLFKNRFLLRSRNEYWFQILIEQQDQLRQVLKQMGADLELDPIWGIAYVKSISEDIEDQIDYQLGAEKTLSRYSSLLLFFLRLKRLHFYRQPDSEVPLIRREEMRHFLEDFNQHLESSRFEKEPNKAILDLCELQVLLKAGVDDCYEITTICDVLLPADQMNSFKERFEKYVHSSEKSPDTDHLESGDSDEEFDHAR